VIEELQQNPNVSIQQAVDKLVSEYMDYNKAMTETETDTTNSQSK
jgi:hypothetical protein